MRVLLIIPAYNEEDNLERVVGLVDGYAREQDLFSLDYIVVNDGSTDSTEQLCREKGIRAIHLTQNLGIGGAVQTGYLFAMKMNYDIAVQFDGDGQHDINSLAELIQPLRDDLCDFTVGSRFIAEDNTFHSTKMRRFGIRFLCILIRLFTGEKTTDPTSGYRAANRRAIRFLAGSYPVDYPEPESLTTLIRNGFHVTEVPVCMNERTEGRSSIRSWKSAYYMIKVSLSIFCASLQRKERS